MMLRIPTRAMPGVSDNPGNRLASDSPPSTKFDDKKPAYITMTMPITKSDPMEPNWPRVCTICGTPKVGPCAACSAMKTAPTALPTIRPQHRRQNGSPNTLTARPPVTTVNSVIFEPNQIVNRSRAVPWR